MIAVEDIELGGIYNVSSYDLETGDIEEISISLCYNKGKVYAEFTDLDILLKRQNSIVNSSAGFKWTYNGNEDESIFKIEYIGNKETNPEYFL